MENRTETVSKKGSGVDLIGELESTKQKATDNIQSALVVDEVKRLMDGSAAEDRKVLSQLGLDKNIKKFEVARGEIIEREKLDKMYEGNVFTLEEIKSLCIEYNLRFLNTSCYSGSVAPELASVVARFAKKHDIRLDMYDNSNFFIMAPKSSFRLEERPKDPLLFYKVSNGYNEYYRLIHKWGSDFTAMRFVRSWKNRSSIHSYFHSLLIVSLVAMIAVGFAGVYSLATSMFIVVPAAMAAVGIIYGIAFGDSGSNAPFADNQWNSTFRN